MTLNEMCTQYSLLRAHSRGSAYLLRWSAGLFSTWLGHEARAGDLTDRSVSEWLASLTCAPSTRAEHRTHLLTVWRWAARRGYCSPPVEVRRERPPEPQPTAWTPDEVARLLAACDQMPDPAWWRLVIQTAICSGLRRSDLWRLESDDMRPDGTIWLEQHKTGWPHVSKVPAEAAKEFCRREGKPLCPIDRRRFYDDFRLLCHLAGVRHGALQMCRRSGATACEIQQPGSASRFLGHLTPGMQAHYVDRSQLGQEPIMPLVCYSS